MFLVGKTLLLKIQFNPLGLTWGILTSCVFPKALLSAQFPIINRFFNPKYNAIPTNCLPQLRADKRIVAQRQITTFVSWLLVLYPQDTSSVCMASCRIKLGILDSLRNQSCSQPRNSWRLTVGRRHTRTDQLTFKECVPWMYSLSSSAAENRTPSFVREAQGQKGPFSHAWQVEALAGATKPL